MTNPDFLERLQAEAQLQAKLHQDRWLPSQLDPLVTLIAQYPWQTLSVAAIVTSIIVRLLTHY